MAPAMSAARPAHGPLPNLARLGVLLAGLALLTAGCLDALERDRVVAGIAEAAAPALPVPLRKSRPYWFLRQEPGWVSAHQAEFGGSADDQALAVIRVARFADIATAQDAFARITPAYLYRLWHSQMIAAPTIVAYPLNVAGVEVETFEYRPRRSPGEIEPTLTVELIIVRSDRMVIAVESLGVPRDKLRSIVAPLVAAVRDAGDQTPA
jgi:hypothetical protein